MKNTTMDPGSSRAPRPRARKASLKPFDMESWLNNHEHLPVVLRDFHDQKDVFKAMHSIVLENPDALVKRPSWIEGHCYVIDVFLRFMARRGYTLQRTRRRGEFRDLANDVKAENAKRCAAFSAALAAKPEQNK